MPVPIDGRGDEFPARVPWIMICVDSASVRRGLLDGRESHYRRCAAVPRRAGRGYARRSNHPALLDRAIGRLEMLCASMLYQKYHRLTLPPLSLQTAEVLGAVIERLLKAIAKSAPGLVRDSWPGQSAHAPGAQ